LQIWDTAGQERFKNIISSYYRGAEGIILVYDITDLDSFNNLNSWLMEIEKNASKNAYKILIGNKSDLENERKVKFSQGKEFAKQYGMNFFETSAKNTTNVIEAFTAITKEIIKEKKNKSINKNKKVFIVDSKKIIKSSCC